MSGLVLTGAQSLYVLPIIAEAESYEYAIDSGVTSGKNTVSEHSAAAHSHTRLVWTAISNIGLGVGFGLLMTAILSFRSRVNWREGLLWGIGGYATFFFAPALGLPPELPGTMLTALVSRQLWWLLAVTFTGIGLLLLILGSPGWLKAVGAALLPVPHVQDLTRRYLFLEIHRATSCQLPDVIVAIADFAEHLMAMLTQSRCWAG